MEKIKLPGAARSRSQFRCEPLESRRMLSSSYTITDLGSNVIIYQPEFLNIPMALNNQGQVVGCETENGTTPWLSLINSN